MEWFIENWQGILNVVVAIVGAAKLGAKLTPNEVDDNKIGKIVKALDVIGMVGNKTQIRIKGKF